MVKKLVLFICLILAGLPSVYSQVASDPDATVIIDKLLETIQQEAIKANFTLTVSDKNNETVQKQQGKFIIKNDRFVFDTDEVKVVFDGKDQWSYMASTNEVSITEPTEDEINQVNPLAVISSYRKNSIIIFSRTEQSAQNDIIVMIPTIPGAEYKTIDIQINKTSANPSYIKLAGNNNYTVEIKFSNFRKGVSVNDKTFTFDSSEYPDIFENDLR